MQIIIRHGKKIDLIFKNKKHKNNNKKVTKRWADNQYFTIIFFIILMWNWKLYNIDILYIIYPYYFNFFYLNKNIKKWEHSQIL